MKTEVNHETQPEERRAKIPVKRLVMPYFRIFVSCLDIKHKWHIQSNPMWDHFSRGCNAILMNTCNEYAEYKNCGVIHRMIRVEDCSSYGIESNEIKAEWTLDPNEA